MTTTKTQTPAEAMAFHGITVESEFVPLSRSRNATEDRPTLNWRVTIKRNGRDVLTTDYSAGVGHAPGYKAKAAPHDFRPRRYRNSSTGRERAATPAETLSQWRDYLTRTECETGLAMEPRRVWGSGGHEPELVPVRKHNREIQKSEPVRILPNPCDVMACLVMDSSVLDCGGFENWAAEFGYDTDSRKAESIYGACLETALALRAGLGGDTLAELAEAFADY